MLPTIYSNAEKDLSHLERTPLHKYHILRLSPRCDVDVCGSPMKSLRRSSGNGKAGCEAANKTKSPFCQLKVGSNDLAAAEGLTSDHGSTDLWHLVETKS